MKFCTKCGTQINDGINFCPKCGANVSQQFQQAAPSNNTYVQPPVTPVYNAVPMTPAIRTLKSIGASPVFLIAVITTTLGILLSLISSISGSANIMNIIYELAYKLDMEYILYEIPDEIFRVFSAGNIFTAFIGMIPSIIMVTGLWLIFAACVDKNGVKFSTAGLTIIKVMNIIGLVFTCIGAVIVEFLLLIAIIGIGAGTGSGEAAAIMFIIMLVSIVIYTLVIMYYVKINKSIASAKNTALTGRPYSYASTFVAVLCIIAAIGSLFSIISSAITGFFSFGAMMTGILTSLCEGISLVCFAITIFTYRSQMSAVSNPPRMVRPMQPTAPVTPAPVVEKEPEPTIVNEEPVPEINNEEEPVTEASATEETTEE